MFFFQEDDEMFKFKKTRPLAFIALATLMACGTQSEDKPKSEQKTEQASQTKSEVANADGETQKISEALGHFIGRNLNAPGIHFDLESIIKGMREGSAGKPAPMSDEDYEKAMAQLQEKAFNNVAETNLEAANNFMKENVKAKDVIEVVPEKLQYLILEEGHDPVVPEHGTPQINYTGKYINGTVFGSSENAGGPITIPIDQTIPGFSKGIAGMKEGEKRRLFVHPDFGYGRTGQLPPNSLLIFDIEVVKATSPEKDLSESDSQADKSHLKHDGDEERDLDDDLEGDQDQEFEEHSKTQEQPVK